MHSGYGFPIATLLVFAGIVMLVKWLGQSDARKQVPDRITPYDVLHLLAILLLVAGGSFSAQNRSELCRSTFRQNLYP